MFEKIEQAIKELQRGDFIILIDDENRENEGDLVIAAEKVTPSKINYLIKNGRGLVCIPMLGERLDQLKLPLMITDSNNTENTKCAFTISVDAKKATTTGISAFDRSTTVKALINPETKPEDLARPGHLFPIRVNDKGVLEREGHTEASVELCKLAGLYPASVICEIIKDNGEMAKLEDLEEFAKHHKLSIYTIHDLIKYLKNKSS
jgi:3,4-dihydroxy-2-butanone 4-phosphate synthase